jgi:hypothetical protein
VRILLDEGVPRPLAKELQKFGVDATPFPNEWKQLANGALLDRIKAEGFDILITNDKNMRHQQNLRSRRIAVLVLPTNRLPELRQLAGQIAEAARSAPTGEFTVLSMG